MHANQPAVTRSKKQAGADDTSAPTPELAALNRPGSIVTTCWRPDGGKNQKVEEVGVKTEKKNRWLDGDQARRGHVTGAACHGTSCSRSSLPQQLVSLLAPSA